MAEMLINGIVDRGVFNIEQYKLASVSYLNNELTLVFKEQNENVDLVFCLKNVISFNGEIAKANYSLFRIDSDGSSYGFDIAIRLHRPELKNFMVLYFFQEKHSVPVFRALSDEIEITGIMPTLS